MIKVKIKEIEYNVPTSWVDVSYSKAIEVIKIEDIDDVLCYLTGIPKDILYTLKESSVAKLFILIRFVEDVEIWNSNEPGDKYKDFDYGSAEYGKTEAVKIIINNNKDKNFLDLAPQIIQKLTGDDISNEPMSEVIGTVGFFLNQWIHYTASSQSLVKVKQQEISKGQELIDLNDSEVLELG